VMGDRHLLRPAHERWERRRHDLVAAAQWHLKQALGVIDGDDLGPVRVHVSLADDILYALKAADELAMPAEPTGHTSRS
jgi:hypothetical protein